MKKLLSLLLALAMCLSFAACGGDDSDKGEEKGKKTETLTVDNVDDYISVDATVTSCTTNKGELLLAEWAMSSGEAEIAIETKNESGAKFENAVITCEVKIGFMGNYGWEFVNDNIHTEKDENIKTIEIELPADGKTSLTEELKMVIYSDDRMVMASDLIDGNISVKIVDVTGSVEA